MAFLGIRPLNKEQGKENTHSHQICTEPPGKQGVSLASEISSAILFLLEPVLAVWSWASHYTHLQLSDRTELLQG